MAGIEIFALLGLYAGQIGC